LIELLESETVEWIRFDLGIAPKGPGNTLILVMEYRRERSKQMRCQNGPLIIRQVLSELLDFGDRSHGTIIVGPCLEASDPTRESRQHGLKYLRFGGGVLCDKPGKLAGHWANLIGGIFRGVRVIAEKRFDDGRFAFAGN